jgi:DNA transformation protein and related proteins
MAVDQRIVQDASMSTPADQFVAHCMELLDTIGRARSRRMFGGHGVYIDDLFVAIIAFDRLYLKADEQTRDRFERAGCEPFVCEKKESAVSLGYWSAPDDAMESPPLMQPWARLALKAALRSRAAKASETVRSRTPAKAAAARRARPSAGARTRR